MSRQAKNYFNRRWRQRRHEAAEKALAKSSPTKIQSVLCGESISEDTAFTFSDKRVYCSKCGALKGSKKTGRYYPDRQCLHCGYTKAHLQDTDGNKIAWEKLLALQMEDAEREYY